MEVAEDRCRERYEWEVPGKTSRGLGAFGECVGAVIARVVRVALDPGCRGRERSRCDEVVKWGLQVLEGARMWPVGKMVRVAWQSETREIVPLYCREIAVSSPQTRAIAPASSIDLREVSNPLKPNMGDTQSLSEKYKMKNQFIVHK